MAFLNSSFPATKVLVRKEFLYDQQSHHNEYETGWVVGVSSIPGYCLMFHVLLENGALFGRLPIHAIVMDEVTAYVPLDHLQVWNCFSYDFTVYQYDFLVGMTAEVYMKDKVWRRGAYLTTVDWCNRDNEATTNLAETPDQYKCAHLLVLSNNNDGYDGYLVAQPNNRIRWTDPALITRDFTEFPGNRPDYKVQTQYYSCESGKSKWVTENTDNFFYEINATE